MFSVTNHINRMASVVIQNHEIKQPISRWYNNSQVEFSHGSPHEKTLLLEW